MCQIYFTSDLHFSHQNIAKFCPQFRPYSNIDEMNEALIRYWNDTVQPEDIVYNLGDISFARDVPAIAKVLRRLNGQHHLIFGNHDNVIINNSKYFLNATKNDGNPMLSSMQYYLKLHLEMLSEPLILFHYPIQEWDGCHKGWYHLYGHLHNRMAKVSGRLLNVGYDLHGRFLIPQDIEEFLARLPKVAHHDEAAITVKSKDLKDAKEEIWAELLRLNYH